MYTYLKLHNFKSFGDIEFNFKRTKKETKKFVAIYGENGCGKTNFVSAFEFLYTSITSSIVRNAIEKMLGNREADKFILPFYELLGNSFTSFSDYRMVECNEPTMVEYGFDYKGIEGYYKVGFTDSIIEEELYYLAGSKRGKLFSVKNKGDDLEIFINKSTFKPSYLPEFEKVLRKFWGKTTFLGAFFNELTQANYRYLEENVSPEFVDLLTFFLKTGVYGKHEYNIGSLKIIPSTDMKTPIDAVGKIPLDEEKQLDQKSEIIKHFFLQLYSDILDVYYEKNKFEDRIEYKLHIKKVISGKVRDVLFDYESTGTKKTLEIINAMVQVMNGATVIYDEIDEGIHDLLMRNIISSLNNSSTGQLIITTHNTLLLENMDPQSAYIIYVDSNGNKEARCCADYGVRIQKTNNMRNQYLNGMFGGIPYTSDIDLSYMAYNKVGDDSVT